MNPPPQPGGDSHPAAVTIVEQRLPVELRLNAHETLPLLGRLVYDPRAPFTALLDFPECSDSTSPWAFSRDLLQGGLRLPTGEGHVRVWPSCRCHSHPDMPASVRILLTDWTAAVLLEAPAEPIREWLIRTWAAVPPGTEGDWLDWEPALTELLNRD
jgi:hypothetical protein